jgi:hypothetical protein
MIGSLRARPLSLVFAWMAAGGKRKGINTEVTEIAEDTEKRRAVL